MLGIILAGGEGTRFLRTGCCKPLLKIGGRYLIEYAMDHLAALHVSEAVIVVGKYGNRISGALGNCYHGIPVTYVMQPEPLGIVNALLCAAPYVKGRTAVTLLSDEMLIDPLYSAGVLPPAADFLCGYTVPADPETIKENYAVVCTPEGAVVSTEEKPLRPVNEKKGTGFCVFDAACTDILLSAYAADGGAGKNLCDFINLLISLGKKGLAVRIAAEEININRKRDLTYAKRRLKREADE